MANEFDLARDVGRAQQAKDVLNAELFQESFEQVRQAILQKWADCPIRDKEGQYELKRQLHSLETVKGYLVTVIESGKMAEVEMNRKRGIVDRIRGVA